MVLAQIHQIQFLFKSLSYNHCTRFLLQSAVSQPVITNREMPAEWLEIRKQTPCSGDFWIQRKWHAGKV